MKDGIIDVWDLPDNIRVTLEADCCSDVLRNGRKKSGSFIKLAKDIKEPLSKKGYPYTIMKLRYEKRHKLSLIKKLIKFTRYNKKKIQIESISIYGRKRERILKPKLPFNFNCPEGVRVISSILFDGGIKNRSLTPTYWNTQEVLREKVVESFNKVFGEIDSKRNKKNENVTFPKICGIILVNGMKMIRGRKVENNPKIPEFIFKTSDVCKSAFLQQAFDDDGTISKDSITISLTKNESNEEHNLLCGIKKMLKELNIESHGPRKIKEYYVGYQKRITYILTITNRENIEKFKEKISFLHPRKKKRIKEILSKPLKERHFSWGTVNEEVMKIMRECQKKYGYFTRKMIAKKINRSFNRSQQLVAYFLEKGTIKIKEPYSGNKEAKLCLVNSKYY